MAGNVREWSSIISKTIAVAQCRSARATPEAKRVYRGGSWKIPLQELKTTALILKLSEAFLQHLGFRIVCECD